MSAMNSAIVHFVTSLTWSAWPPLLIHWTVDINWSPNVYVPCLCLLIAVVIQLILFAKQSVNFSSTFYPVNDLLIVNHVNN